MCDWDVCDGETAREGCHDFRRRGQPRGEKRENYWLGRREREGEMRSMERDLGEEEGYVELGEVA